MRHLMSYAHMTSVYDVDRFGWSWCLKKRLDHSNHTRSSDFGLKIVLKFKNRKACLKYFSFIHFDNPLYFSVELEVEFGLTFVIARILIFFANHIRIKIWMGISCKLIQFPKKWKYETRYSPPEAIHGQVKFWYFTLLSDQHPCSLPGVPGVVCGEHVKEVLGGLLLQYFEN